jgi:hypothetical protein
VRRVAADGGFHFDRDGITYDLCYGSGHVRREPGRCLFRRLYGIFGDDLIMDTGNKAGVGGLISMLKESRQR